jgi:hypothetical protein
LTSALPAAAPCVHVLPDGVRIQVVPVFCLPSTGQSIPVRPCSMEAAFSRCTARSYAFQGCNTKIRYSVSGRCSRQYRGILQ